MTANREDPPRTGKPRRRYRKYGACGRCLNKLNKHSSRVAKISQGRVANKLEDSRRQEASRQGEDSIARWAEKGTRGSIDRESTGKGYRMRSASSMLFAGKSIRGIGLFTTILTGRSAT